MSEHWEKLVDDRAQLSGAPGAPALSGAALKDRAATDARVLSGLQPGSRVVVASADGVEVLIRIMACWQAGHCPVVVNPGLKPDERARVTGSTGASLYWQDAPERLARDAEDARTDTPAVILMTSGTTGIPKGVCLSFDALHARIAANRAHISDPVLRRTLCPLPVFFGHGLIGNCLTALASGGEVTLLPTGVQGAAALAQVLEDGRITFLSSVPTFWRLAMRGRRPDLAPERVHVGSAPLSIPHWEAIAGWVGTREVWNMLGMTETANWVGGGPLDAARGRDGYVGRPWAGTAYAVFGENGPLPAGTGEILVNTTGLMDGFWGRAEASRAALTPDGWLRSGDVGELDADGALTLKGRLKSEINCAGIKIQAEEIDMLLERHPAVAEACAFAIPDAVTGEAVAAAVTPATGKAEADAILSWCRDEVRAEAVPRKLFILDDIPRNDRGKVVRTDVRATCLGEG